jgi:predicted helicase
MWPRSGGGERVSRQLISEYRSELDRIHAASGSKRESVVREAFKDLLKRWGKSRDLIFLAEHEYITATGDRRYIDGALVHSIRVPFGYWEAKDTNDDLDEEIRKKTSIGYPRDNIIYEDTGTAVLIQNRREVARVSMEDADRLFHLLESFFAYERPEIADFRKAVRQFAADLPAVLQRLREIIAEKRAASRDFANAERKFLDHAREAINPAVSEEDVQEMLLQHVLTEDIFAKVFDNPEFHRRNNVAAELYKLEEKLFGYGEKSKLLAALRPYYAGIESTAALIESHSEKQQFLKGLYENFYKVYNPLAADRLGVVYTPGEIVRFMIRSADWLCHKHFGKGLDDRGVEILDPATGTGTFIVELLEHFRGNRDKLAYKYKEELHANEVAILPYYVANLNIEATYHAITGQFAEFPGLVLVDTLDNVAALGIYAGHQHSFLGGLSDENLGRIKRQNERGITLIIGNPPYNAWQESFNDGNPNRFYDRVDKRIADTYVKEGTGQNQNSVYDMYTRFIRWASDRLGEEGIITLVIGRKPITKGAYNGFRRVVRDEFSEIYLLDLGGDVRDNPELSGTTHNVFGIQTGVMIAVFVRRRVSSPANIFYARRPEFETADDKLSFLTSSGSLESIQMDSIQPDRRSDWLGQSVEEWVDFIPLANPEKRRTRSTRRVECVFEVVSAGLQTKQDDWAYSRTRESVVERMTTLMNHYNDALRTGTGGNIKWHRELAKRKKKGEALSFSEQQIINAPYRAFTNRFLYFDKTVNSQSFRLHELYRTEPNDTLVFSEPAYRTSFSAFAVTAPPEHHLLASKDSFGAAPRYRYAKSGDRLDNITDWALKQFEAHYGKEAGVTKDAIFAYCYAVLHDPVYREKYALNLKREFPRIPFYDDFALWAGWGQQLLDLHIGYEQAEPFAFTTIDTPNPKRARGSHPKPKLKSEPDKGLVIVDEDTRLTGIAREAWDYRLGNRSAIDWVLDQHKEKTPRDPTVREKFNTYRFADYKESMIDLLARVITVSLETVKITEAMRDLDRNPKTTA